MDVNLIEFLAVVAAVAVVLIVFSINGTRTELAKLHLQRETVVMSDIEKAQIKNAVLAELRRADEVQSHD